MVHSTAYWQELSFSRCLHQEKQTMADLHIQSEGPAALGDVFTPMPWARFAVRKTGLARALLEGATILDPAMGSGNLLAAVLEEARQLDSQGTAALSDGIQSRLAGVERDPVHFAAARERFAGHDGLLSGLVQGDLFTSQPRRADILFANPPWMNYTSLPETEKNRLRILYTDYGLSGKGQHLLWGSARVDLSALVLQYSLFHFLKKGGRAVFFLPLSLFYNDGAHKLLRRCQVKGVDWAVTRVHQLPAEAFGVGTRCGLFEIERDRPQQFPVPAFQTADDGWEERMLFPEGAGNAWCLKVAELPRISVSRENLPRQGINTCGANAVFYFNEPERISEDFFLAGECKLPARFMHPVLTSRDLQNWKESVMEQGDVLQAVPSRYVLLPWLKDGWIQAGDLEQFPELNNWLQAHRQQLQNRRGKIIGSAILRGIWWSLLGVGPYCFAPWKIIWQAAGARTFDPVLCEGHWQMNQSMQAGMAFDSREDAERVLALLRRPQVEEYLKSYQMGGTLNWAQPGKIKKILSISE
jgi:hypothetical protein